MIRTDGEQTIANAPPKPFDMVGFVMAFESGDLDEDAIIEGFQHLIDSGTVWSLQGTYGRTALALIEGGLCTNPRKPQAKPELVGTFCECGAAYDPELPGYGCAR